MKKLFLCLGFALLCAALVSGGSMLSACLVACSIALLELAGITNIREDLKNED